MDEFEVSVTYTPPAQSNRLTVTPGDLFAINLSESPDSGYRWETDFKFSPRLVKLHQTLLPRGRDTILGGVKADRLTYFQATAAGIEMLEFHLNQPWARIPTLGSILVFVNIVEGSS